MTYIFSHIHKTAGTTFHTSYLGAAFQPESYLLLTGTSAQRWAEFERLKALDEKEREKLFVIGGHDADLLRPSFPRAKYITLIRNPVARVISLYLHGLYHEGGRHPVGNYLRQHNLSLADFAEADIHAVVSGLTNPGSPIKRTVSVHNAQAEQLLGIPSAAIALLSRSELLRRINERFYLVGLSEELARFLFHLHVHACFPLMLFTNLLVRKETASFVPDPAVISRIQQVTELDKLVYELVQQQFDEIISTTWDSHDRAEFDKYQRELLRFQSLNAGNDNASARYVSARNMGRKIKLLTSCENPIACACEGIEHEATQIAVRTSAAPWTCAALLNL